MSPNIANTQRRRSSNFDLIRVDPILRVTTIRFAMFAAFALFIAPLLAAAHAHDYEATYIGDAHPLLVDPQVEIDKPVVLANERPERRFVSQGNLQNFKAEPEKYFTQVDARINGQLKPLCPLKACVVSGEKLSGDMGNPIDYVIGNRLDHHGVDPLHFRLSIQQSRPTLGTLVSYDVVLGGHDLWIAPLCLVGMI